MKRSPRLVASLLALLAALWPGVAGHAAPAEALTPTEVVRQTADRVVAVLAQKELPLEERRRRIEEIAYDRFDIETISRLILARHYRRFTPEQRDEFVSEFKRHLIVNYGDRIDRYEQEGIEVLGERSEPRGDVTVRTRIIGGQADTVAVDYRLRQRDGRWLVIDIVVEGVSVLKSYRSQFQEILGNGDPDRLLRQLRDKNAADGARTAEDGEGDAAGATAG